MVPLPRRAAEQRDMSGGSKASIWPLRHQRLDLAQRRAGAAG
jgi:hypothetical protein